MPSPLPLKLVKVNTILPDGTSGNCGYLNNTSSMATFTAMADLIEDTRYTLSLTVKADALSTLSVTSGAHGETLTRVVGTDWTRIAITFTSDGRDLSFILPRGEYYFYHAKLEKGSVATDWSPSPLDAGFGASFGGRNYILNSNVNTVTTSSSICSLDTSMLLETDTTYTLTVNGGFGDYVEYPDDYYIHCSLHSNDDGFTVEFDIKGASEIGEGTIKPHYESFKTPYSFPSSITSFTLDCTYVYPDGSEDIPEATVKWVKLERGNKPTDWTPAPEDIQNGIADLDFNLRTTIETAKDSVIATADEHTTELIKSKVDISEYEMFVAETNTKFQQTSDGFEFEIGELSNRITNVDNSVHQDITSYIKHITFNQDGITISPTYFEGTARNLLSFTQNPKGVLNVGRGSNTLGYNEWGIIYRGGHPSYTPSCSVDILDLTNFPDNPSSVFKSALRINSFTDSSGYEVEMILGQRVHMERNKRYHFEVWINHQSIDNNKVTFGYLYGSSSPSWSGLIYKPWGMTPVATSGQWDLYATDFDTYGDALNEGGYILGAKVDTSVAYTPTFFGAMLCEIASDGSEDGHYNEWTPSLIELRTLSLIVDSTAIKFVNGSEVIGEWDGNNFYTGNINIRVNERAQFGNFAYVPRDDSSLMFLKVQ